jgi:hypothetical protein
MLPHRFVDLHGVRLFTRGRTGEALAALGSQARMGEELKGGRAMSDWIEALKFGPASIAAIVAVRTALLLQTELTRDKVRPEARRLITQFMVFAIVLTIISLGFTLYDHAQSKASETAKDMTAKAALLEGKVSDLQDRLGKVREIAGAMDMALLNKATADSAIENNDTLKNLIKTNIETMCGDVGRIGGIAGDITLGMRCKRNSGLQVQ